jgi:hypothetical protein
MENELGTRFCGEYNDEMSCDSKANGFGILPFLLDEISLKISN